MHSIWVLRCALKGLHGRSEVSYLLRQLLFQDFLCTEKYPIPFVWRVAGIVCAIDIWQLNIMLDIYLSIIEFLVDLHLCLSFLEVLKLRNVGVQVSWAILLLRQLQVLLIVTNHGRFALEHEACVSCLVRYCSIL